MLGIGRTKVYELVNDGELELVHIGCRALVPVDSVQSFSDRLRARHGEHRFRSPGRRPTIAGIPVG